MVKKKTAKGKKGKGGKGKKEGRQESKGDKESEVEKVKASTALWEAKLEVTETSRVEYREAARRLARANNDLSALQHRAEQDMVDVISLVKRREAEQDDKIWRLEEQLRSHKALAHAEQQKMVEEHKVQIQELEERFKKRASDFNTIQDEFKKIREFKKRKAQMEQELINIKESMCVADKNHKENLSRMELKFFREKVRLEKEAEQRIAQLAERAHNDAIVTLDDASRSVFKENVRLNEALKYHVKEVEELRKLSTSLAEEKASMALNKDTDELIIRKNAAQLKAQRHEISKLKSQVVSLEQGLELTAGELERERGEVSRRALVSDRAGQAHLQRVQKALAAREGEIARVKRLAGAVVEQRTELERFFHLALGQVKREIQAGRSQHREQALKAYNARMSEAMAGRQSYPLIRTFRKTPHGAGGVYSDMEEAEKWDHLQGNQVDISDLTWEQKEKVLRLLFAKMNGQKARKPGQALALPASWEKNKIDSNAAGITEEPSLVTFITQAPVSNLPANPNSLPDIHTT